MCQDQHDLDILFAKVTAQIEDKLHLKNTLYTLCLRGWGFHAKPIFFFDTLALPSPNSDSWRRYTLKCLHWYVKGKVELVLPGGASEDCL